MIDQAVAGFVMIAVGICWQRQEREIGERLRAFLPHGVRDVIAQRAA